MARFPVLRTAPIFVALLIAGALAQPARAMEVTINEVQSSIRTNDGGGGGSYLGGLVDTVLKAIEEDAQRKRRQQSEQRPQQPA